MSVPAIRLTALWIPDWPVLAVSLDARAQVGTPDPAIQAVAIVSGRGVEAASPLARAAGVRTGMRVRMARSLCPEVILIPADPRRDVRVFEQVMEPVSSVLAEPLVLRPGLVVSESSGPARWWGGEEEVAQALIEAVAEHTGTECQVGVADSLLAAVLAARIGQIIPAGQSPHFLAPWPVEELTRALPTHRQRQETAELATTLRRLGTTTLGALAMLPAADVEARFGPVGRRAHALACGQGWWVRGQERPRQDLEVAATLDPPATQAEVAAFTVRRLAERLADMLARQALAAGRLVVEAGCQDGTERVRAWALQTLPTPGELTDRVRWQLDGWLSACDTERPGAPLTRIRLLACDLHPAGATQPGLWKAPGQESRERADRAAQRLEALLGAGAVRTPRLRAGRDPRSRASLVAWGTPPGTAGRDGTVWGDDVVPCSGPAFSPGPRDLGSATSLTWGGADGAGHGRGGLGRDASPGLLPVSWVGLLPEPSPGRVLAQPRPVEVVDGEGRDVEITAQGKVTAVPALVRLPHEEVVVSWAGPWPVTEGWWRQHGASRRAYLQVVTRQGPPLLLVRSGRWWLDAVYD